MAKINNIKKNDLHDSLINVLNNRTSNKKELAYTISEILDIEIESAYRRLSGKVHFTVKEIGILAKELQISLDSLLNEDSNKISVYFEMDSGSIPKSIDLLSFFIEESVAAQKKMTTKEIEAGTIFDSIPIDFYIFYPVLARLMYFKWGRYYVGTKEFDHFSNWEIPERLINAQNQLKECYKYYKKVFYIWDISLLWNLVHEIKYYMLIDAITSDEVKLIKADLNDLLINLKEFIEGDPKLNPYNIEFEFYVTNFNIATTSYFIHYQNSYLSGIKTGFLQSVIHYNYDTGYRIKQWITSVKKFSSLISGSGEKERKLFFKEQHQIVDTL